jgi:hypothetical protein
MNKTGQNVAKFAVLSNVAEDSSLLGSGAVLLGQ